MDAVLEFFIIGLFVDSRKGDERNIAKGTICQINIFLYHQF